MKTITLSNQSPAEIVTTRPNTPGVATPVFTVRVPDGAAYILPNQTTVSGVLYNGAVIVTDLRNSAGDRIRAGNLVVGFRAPNAEFVTPQRALPLSNWADLSTTQQKNAQFRGTLAQSTDLNVGPSLTLRNRSALVLSVDSPEVVDWTKSYLEVTFEEVNG